ncbi:hypothetical protein UY3_02944 [Chelonia mydas]|uniref:Uncharacterized protein n=1 Tax=Chelonia mydas TaxID=8469 RepID=M7BVL6_CHEMY|nr:hypothetical protein UY3_02944 [Chelonia mydas]
MAPRIQTSCMSEKLDKEHSFQGGTRRFGLSVCMCDVISSYGSFKMFGWVYKRDKESVGVQFSRYTQWYMPRRQKPEPDTFLPLTNIAVVNTSVKDSSKDKESVGVQFSRYTQWYMPRRQKPEPDTFLPLTNIAVVNTSVKDSSKGPTPAIEVNGELSTNFMRESRPSVN